MEIKQHDATWADRKSAVCLFDCMSVCRDLWFPHGSPSALDAFARNGQLTVKSYAGWASAVDCWELSPEHYQRLRELHVRDVQIGCSYKTLQTCGQQYDMIVIDTPQGVHTDWSGMKRVEHFDFLAESTRLIGESGVFVLYVNKRPYNREDMGEHGYDRYQEYDWGLWRERRTQLYGSMNIDEEQALAFYRQLMAAKGLLIKETLIVPCLSDVPGYEPYAFRLAMRVVR